jgi:2-keto-4-pentenoate hydratase/2-oxohepta-3-ene-1,7-dioic acid hydratase in catechol pathway
MRGNNPILLRLDGLPIPEHPTLTPRHPGRLIGHQEPITLRPEDGEIAWGAEFVAVVGRVTRDVDVLQAKDAVAGYMATNDLSGSCFAQVIAPDLSRDNYNYRDEHFAGKFYGTWSMPQSVGPWLVTADEIDDPYHLTVAAYENGVPCDIVTTAAMLFTFEDLISFLSRFMTLRPGDLISSGALGYHVINGLDSYPSGSEFAIEIEHVGTLRNPIDDRRGVAAP